MQKNVMQMIGCAMLLLLPAVLSGQIVIDYNEIPHIVNTRWTKNIAYEQTVNLGTSGGPQTWTFTNQPMGTDSCTNTVVAVSSTPFHDSFPNANLSYMQVDGGDSAFLYMRLVSSFINMLGIAGEDSSGVYYMVYAPVDTNNLPEHYGDSRHYRAGWRYNVDASTYIIYVKKGYETINAYGNVTIPYGTFPCLRFILFDTLIQTMYYNNVPVFYDTTTRISHQFVAENRSGVVCVFSHAGETNPYFTNAQFLERLTYFYTGVEEQQTGSVNNKVIAAYPSAFVTGVRFTCRQPGQLEIRDALGRTVRSCELSDGFVWNGTDGRGTEVPAGVYFYRFKTEGQSATGKVTKTY